MSAVTIAQLQNAANDVDHIADIATSTELTATDRLGRTKLTLHGALASLGYQPPVAYAAGINLTAGTQTVEHDGDIYAPLIAQLPFTTSGTFESAKFRVVQGITREELVGSSGSGLVGWVRNALSAAITTVGKWIEFQKSSVFDFMTDAQITDAQSGAPALDHTAAILAYKAHAVANLPFTMRFPKGVFRYSDLGNLAYKGLTIEGWSHRETVLKCTASGNALYIDAFQAGLTGNDATAPFVQQFNMRNITVEGNTGTTAIINAQGIARSKWENVYVREGNTSSCIAFDFKGVMLSTFINVGCSTDLDTMTYKPYEGLRLSAGSRAGSSVGNCSNNVFVTAQFEGLPITGRIAGGDQNTFIGGTFESATTYGLLVGSGCRYNTLIGTGFESPSSTADVSDAGISTKYVNCYSAKNIVFQGRACVIDGGFYERIDVQAGAVRNSVKDVTINHWASGSGGYVDNGTATSWKNIYDADAAAFVYPKKDRASITVGASPFRYTNNTGQYIEVRVSGGTVSQVLQYRGSDFWITPNLDNLQRLLAPGDQIDVTYSSAPTMSYIPHGNL